MTLLDRLTAAIRRDPGAKPRDDQLDLFGVTHPGKVRRDNQVADSPYSNVLAARARKSAGA